MIATVSTANRSPKAGDWLDKPTLRSIRHWAHLVAKRLSLSHLEREDVEQELLLHLVQRLARFDAGRATQATFIERVVRNKARTIVRDELRKKRHAVGCVSIERLCRPERDTSEGEFGTNGPEARELSLPCVREEPRDADVVVDQLPESLRPLVGLLGTVPHAAVRRQLGLSKYTFYKLLGELRKHLTDLGFAPHLGKKFGQFGGKRSM